MSNVLVNYNLSLYICWRLLQPYNLSTENKQNEYESILSLIVSVTEGRNKGKGFVSVCRVRCRQGCHMQNLFCFVSLSKDIRKRNRGNPRSHFDDNMFPTKTLDLLTLWSCPVQPQAYESHTGHFYRFMFPLQELHRQPFVKSRLFVKHNIKYSVSKGFKGPHNKRFPSQPKALRRPRKTP